MNGGTRRFESRPVGWVKSGLFAVATLITLWSLTSFTATMAAVVFAVLGSQFGRSLSKRNLKLSMALWFTTLGVVLSFLVPAGIRQSTFLFDWLDARQTLVVADCVAFGLLVWSICFGVRYLSTRWRVWSTLEAAIVVGSVALLFARHRNMAFHRPRFLTDWALVNGMDPQLVLQGVGIVIAAIAIMMLLWQQSHRKLALSLVVLLILAAVAYHFRGDMKVETPLPDFLAGDKDSNKQGKGSGDGTSGGGGKGPPDPPLPVAVALLHSDYEPDNNLLYFRQQVLSQFDGKRLVADASGTFDKDVIRAFPHQSVLSVKLSEPDEMHLMALMHNVGELFFLQVFGEIFQQQNHQILSILKALRTPKDGFHKRVPTSMFLMVDHPQPVALSSSVEIRPRPNPAPNRFVTAYDTVSLVPAASIHELRLLGRASMPSTWSDEHRKHYLAYPDDPRYAALANEITREVDPRYTDDTLIKALSIKRYLEKNGFYTRKERHAGVEDPAASFLFGNLRGYCVHFAHSAAHLFRAVGIASRVAVGYAVDNRMRGGGSAVLIMGDRAHAWPEIHVDGVGWMAFDIYPEQSDEPPPQLISQSLESLLGELARNDKSGGRAADPDEDPLEIPWALIFSTMGNLLTLLLLLAYGIKHYRVLRPKWANAPPHQWSFKAILDQLSDVGMARRFGETREKHALRLADVIPSFEQLTASHLHLSLGEPRRSGAGIGELCLEVRKELKSNLPWWKRILGFLNPVGWCFTR